MPRAETRAQPQIPPARLYKARERWFDPAPYRQFARKRTLSRWPR